MDGFAVRAAETPGRLPVAYRVAAGGAPPGRAPSWRGGRDRDGRDGAGRRGCSGAGRARRGSRRPRRRARMKRLSVSTSGHAAATSGRATSSWLRERDSAPCRSERWVRPVSQRVVCSARPRVAILATGSELRNPGESLEAGQIYESNRRMIAAALASSGAEINVLPVAADDSEAHRDAIARGLEHDVLVTSGGVSMGPARPRAPGRCRARRRRGLLGSRDQARKAARLRRSRRHARVRASREPGVVARRRARLRASRTSRAAGCRESEAELPPRARRRRRFGAIRTATSSCARRASTRGRSSSSSRSSARSRT